MALSLYEITIPAFLKDLQILSKLLKKGESHVSSPDTLLGARLIADMEPLTYQIQRVSDTAKGVAVRVGKAAPVAMEDNEKTFAELQARIQKTIEVLENLDPKSMDGKEDDEVEVAGRKVKARDYITGFAIPNFYFHYVTTYALLRKEGVPIGKKDYLGLV
jgi:hypothetical protein